jgi:hypothetical protein
MRSSIIAALALTVVLSACNSSPPPANQTTAVTALNIGGKPTRCLRSEDLNLGLGGTTDLVGDIRDRLLTPEAKAAGVRVYISGADVNNYGQVVLHYSNRENTCVLFSEGISLQELGQRVGLSPLGISPFYDATPPKTPATPPKTGQ